MSAAKVLSTRLLETFVIAGVVLGGVILVLQSDIEHIKSDVKEQKDDNRTWYRELRSLDKELDNDVQTLKAEFYKHGH